MAQTNPPDSTLSVDVPATPQDPEKPTVPGETRAQTNARTSHVLQPGLRQMSFAEDTVDALFDQPVRVTLHLSPGHVNTILYGESAPTDAEGGNRVDTRAATIVSSGELETVIEITPEHLGTQKISLLALYDDNSSAEGELTLNVATVPGKAKQLCLYLNHIVMILKVSGSKVAAERKLLPEVQFGDNPRWVSIPDLSQLHDLKVIQDEKNPVIEMDDAGLVKALTPGTARITGEFDGIQGELIVEVKQVE
jgi:hypothetical protein